MRIRTIKPEFWTDSLMVSMPRDVRLFYIGLWNASDDHGWVLDDPEQLKMLLFPGDCDADVASWIDLLVSAGRLERVVTPEGNWLLRIAHWKDHQRVDHPGASKISREGSRKLAIPLHVRRSVAEKYGCPPGGTVGARCYFCGFDGSVHWFKLSNGRPSSWVIFPGLELDHFKPESEGGEGVADNIVLSCRSCNRSRHKGDALEFMMSLAEKFATPREPSRLIRDQGSGKGTGTKEQGTGSAEGRTAMVGSSGKLVGGASPASRKPRLTDEQFLAELMVDPTYAGIDVSREHGKMLRWCEVNRRHPTRRRFLNWLNRAERPMSGKAPNEQHPNDRHLSGGDLWDSTAPGGEDDVPFHGDEPTDSEPESPGLAPE